MRPWIIHAIAALGVIVASAMPAHAEFCGPMGLEPRVVSGVDLVLPADGGVLVAAVPGFSRDFDSDAADQPKWRFQTAGLSTEPRRTTLAPGLVVYEARQDGSLILVDGAEKPRATTFVTRRARARLTAPVVKYAVRSPDRVDVFVELEATPPEEAVALVIVGRDGKPRSWDFLDPDSTTQRAFKQRGCEIAPPGTLPSHAGDEVTFFYVDIYGRRSLSTRAITLADKTPSEKRLAPK